MLARINQSQLAENFARRGMVTTRIVGSDKFHQGLHVSICEHINSVLRDVKQRLNVSVKGRSKTNLNTPQFGIT